MEDDHFVANDAKGNVRGNASFTVFFPLFDVNPPQ